MLKLLMQYCKQFSLRTLSSDNSSLLFFRVKKIVYIYKLGFFSFNKIAEVDYIENLNIMKVNIKSKLDEINKKEKTIFDDWDGYLDKASGRDDRLNKLGIN